MRYPANRAGAMTVADLVAAGRNQVPLGIAYMVGSTAMFPGGNAGSANSNLANWSSSAVRLPPAGEIGSQRPRRWGGRWIRTIGPRHERADFCFRKANCGTERGQPKMVRIHLPRRLRREAGYFGNVGRTLY